MTRQQAESVTSPTSRRLGRRSLLGLLGAAPLAAGGAWALTSGMADAAGTARRGSEPGGPPVPVGLRPGGELDQLLARLAKRDMFSGTVLITNGSRTVYARTHGMADTAKAIENTPDTIFCLASVTKLFTAVAVAQLVQRGAIEYEATLGTYLRGFPAAVADHVTVHQLLTHTAGLGDYFELPGFHQKALTWHSAEQVMDGTLEFIRAAPLLFAPGTGHQYSNSGYAVLGAIVASAARQSYYEYIPEQVLRPAGMTDSGFFTKPRWQADPRIAHPYSHQSPAAPRVDVLDQELFIGLPDGNAFATAADMVRFARALLDGTLLEPAYVDLLVGAKFPVVTMPARPGAPGRPPLPRQSLYEAYGPAAYLANGSWWMGHNGGSPGISTDVSWYPSQGWVAVMLSNYDPQDTAIVANTIHGILQ